MRIDSDVKLDYDDVLIRPKSGGPGSRNDVDLIREFHHWPNSTTNKVFSFLPIISANMDSTGTKEMAMSLYKHQAMVALHKHYSTSQMLCIYGNNNNFTENIFFTIGMDIAPLTEISWIAPQFICIDVANGYMDGFIEHCRDVRKLYPRSIIMAGNVCTPERTQELIVHGGVDIVKIGIGPGSVCTTRIVTGCGYPQLSAIIECADAAHAAGTAGYICADGGCKTSGDVAKAFAAGADFVMLGSMFAGCDECDGDWEYNGPVDNINGFGQAEFWNDGESPPQIVTKKSLLYYGMSSNNAQDKYNGESAYRPSEGKAVKVPYKGPVDAVMRQITGGIKSACTMAGASKLKHLPRCTTFVRCTNTHNQMYSGGEQI